MEQATAIHDRMIGQILAIGSQRQRAAFLDGIGAEFHAFLSLVLQDFGDSPHSIHAAFELVLRRKAIAAEAVATQRDALLGGKYPALDPKLRELIALGRQIARKTLAGLDRRVLSLTCNDLPSWVPRENAWSRIWPARSPR